MKQFINPQTQLEKDIGDLFEAPIQSEDMRLTLLSGFLSAATTKRSSLNFKAKVNGIEIHELIKHLTQLSFTLGTSFYELHCAHPDLFPITYNKNYILRSLVHNGRFSIPNTSFNLLLNHPDVCAEIAFSGNDVLQLIATKGDFSIWKDFMNCDAVVTLLCHPNNLDAAKLMQAAIKGQSVEIVDDLLKFDTIKRGICDESESILEDARKAAQTNRAKGTHILASIKLAIAEQKSIDRIPVSLRISSTQTSSTARTSLQPAVAQTSAVSATGGQKRNADELDDDNTAAAIVTSFTTKKANTGQASTSSTSAVPTRRRLTDAEIEKLQSDNEKLKVENEMMRILVAQDPKDEARAKALVSRAMQLGMQPYKAPK